jgi:hypothetical protein
MIIKSAKENKYNDNFKVQQQAGLSKLFPSTALEHCP